MNTDQKPRPRIGLFITGAILAIIALIALPFVVWPLYRIWQQGLEGEARLKRAQQEKQILVEQARAEVEAADLRASAIAKIGAMAQQYPEYRNQEFIAAFADALQNGNIEKMIFVPTEANIPIIQSTAKK